MPDNRETLQVNQPNIINSPETNWPEPLVDPSGKLRMAVTNGSNGSQRNFDPISTSQQDSGAHSLSEGANSPGGTIAQQGSNANQIQTSQQNADALSTPES